MPRYIVDVEEDNGGCGPVILGIILVLILAVAVSCNNSGGSSSSREPTPQVKDGNVVVTEVQGEAEPCYLANLHVYDDHSDIISNIEDSGTISDSFGKTYNAPYFDLCSYGSNGSYDAVQAYTDLVTDGKYMYLEGTYFCRQNQSEDYTITFQVYADGKLVYDSGEISKSTKATYFKVSIDYADIVRVISFSDDFTSMGTNPGVILVDAIVYN